jgi:two-component system LytT family response regulator
MKILVVDNDALLRSTLVDLIRLNFPDITAIAEASGVQEGLAQIKAFHPDLVFLDVEMEDGTGFDLLGQIPEYKFQLVFVTAFNKYAVDAFKFSAIDFILKPVDSIELVEAINRANDSLKNQHIAEQLEVMKTALQELRAADQKIVLRDNKSLYFVKVADIFHCEAQGSYTTFFLQDGTQIVVSRPLKEYENLLEEFGFVRSHHSHLVNIKKITRLDKADGGLLILENGNSVPVSQRKWDHIMEVLDKLTT